MELPGAVKVIGQLYEVARFDPDDTSAVLGNCNFRDCRIRVANGMSPGRTGEVFLHELVHAVNYEIGVDDGAKEEDFVAAVSSGLWAVFQDNPGLNLVLESLYDE